MQSKSERIKNFLTSTGVNSGNNLSCAHRHTGPQNLLSIFQFNWKFITSSVLVAVLSLLFYYPIAFLVLLFLLYSIFLVLIAIMGTMYFQQLYRSKPYPDPRLKSSNILASVVQHPMFECKGETSSSPTTARKIKSPSNLPMIFSKTVDLQLQQILEHILDDFMMSWLKNVTGKPADLNDLLRKDIWNAVQRIHERAKKLDGAKIIAVDMVNRLTIHLEKIRIAELRANENLSSTVVFSTHSYLADEEKELQFLSKLCETIIILLLPRGYSMPPLKNLLCEILSYKILYPLIKMITSPDYVNQKIVQNFENSLKAAAISRRSYEYADNYVDILNIINSCDNLEELTLLRQSVINDLLHATTMQQNLLRSSGKGFTTSQHHHHHHSHHSQHHHQYHYPQYNSGGSSASNSSTQHGTNALNLSKTEQITANKLKQYIEQLKTAKVQCERNLERHGWSLSSGNDGGLSITLKKVLNTAIGRQHLMLFLGPLKATTLVEFYYAVEKLRYTSKSFTYQLASDIFYSYIKVPNPEIILEKNTHKQLESFLIGDVGVDVFYEVQKQVYQTLEEKYYQPFLLSEQCHLLRKVLSKEENKEGNNVSIATNDITMPVDAKNNGSSTITTSTPADLSSSDLAMPTSDITEITSSIATPRKSSPSPSPSHHSTQGLSSAVNAREVGSYSLYIRKKLDEIQDRIDKKQQALEALRYSMKSDSKILPKLQRDIDCLEMAKCQAETQLKRTDIWMENLGKWKANVQNVEISDESESIQFIILVYVDEEEMGSAAAAPSRASKGSRTTEEEDLRVPGSASNGWVVMKTLKELQEIHSKLKQLRPQLKSVEFPTNFKLFFIRNERNSLEKIKKQTQRFLNMILEDELLNGCEAIYIFLGPFSSDHLSSYYGGPAVGAKRSKFSLTTLFRSEKLDSSFSPMDRNEIIVKKSHEHTSANSGSSGNAAGNPLDFNSLNSIDIGGLNSATLNDHDNIQSYLDDHSMATSADHKGMSGDGESKDSIAEPIYALMGEIFDMGGVFKWLRKSLISFVQITYGRTINRQIRESTAYLFEETMLHYYFSSILKSFWPGGVLVTTFQPRSEEIKEGTANTAKDLLIANIPEILCNLVGTQAAKRGILKVFTAFQNPIYNKQLFYELLEIVMLEFFPEIKQLRLKSSVSTKATVNVKTTTATVTSTNTPSMSSATISTASTSSSTVTLSGTTASCHLRSPYKDCD